MILNTVHISNEQLVEIDALVNICEKYDDAKMCIQTDHSLNIFKDLKSWILYYKGEELTGIVSIFAPLSDEAEISVCVSPKYRRMGIARELVETAVQNVKEFKISNILYACDRNSKTGTAILKNKKFVIHHTEYTMKFIKSGKKNCTQSVIAKPAGANDIETLIAIFLDVFDSTLDETKNFIESSIKSETRKGYIGITGNKNIGIAFVGYGTDISINTFGIVKAERNKGYGTELLSAIISQIDYSDKDIIIDVDSNNINAYKLYKKAGFQEITTIDYYTAAGKSMPSAVLPSEIACFAVIHHLKL